MAQDHSRLLIGGAQVTVTTSDGHRFEGRLIETRQDRFGRDLAVIRLDSGWITSYPLSMVKPMEPELS